MRMRNILVGIAAACLVSVAAVGAQHHAGGAPGTQAATSDADVIKSAMSAAPAAVAKDAAVVAMTADGKMRTVRSGTNGFTCMPDNPETPGPDPMCADGNAMEWLGAYMARKTPATDRVGLVYMLAGGTDASNTDPYAQKPTATNNWINTGPHVMLLGSKSLLEGYPRDARPATSAPYVMWAGTPYEHLMVPVK